MIEPGDLYRYFAVRETKTGREVRLMNWDVRYTAVGGDPWSYCIRPDGDRFLVQLPAAHGPYTGFVLRLDEVEPLPEGRGLMHPTHLTLTYALDLERNYEGSWRQYADSVKGQVA